ncbi:hypothetical protein N9M16_05525 [Candidatus Dependentiae bacterium]|nr:hypothetical protein [Candidatus Dependentiae bacterium]
MFCVQDKHGNSYDNVFTHAGVSLFISTLVRAIRMTSIVFCLSQGRITWFAQPR